MRRVREKDGIPAVCAMPEFAPDDEGLERSLFLEESPKPFA